MLARTFAFIQNTHPLKHIRQCLPLRVNHSRDGFESLFEVLATVTLRQMPVCLHRSPLIAWPISQFSRHGTTRHTHSCSPSRHYEKNCDAYMGCLSNKGLKCKWGRFSKFLVSNIVTYYTVSPSTQVLATPEFLAYFHAPLVLCLGQSLSTVPVHRNYLHSFAIQSYFKALWGVWGEVHFGFGDARSRSQICLRHDGRASTNGVDRCTMLLKANISYSFIFARQYICSFLARAFAP